jgi:hypothetical protein
MVDDKAIEADALGFASLGLILHAIAPYSGGAVFYVNALAAICDLTAGVLGFFGLAYDRAFLFFHNRI